MPHTASQNGEWFASIVTRYEGLLVRYAAGITGNLDQARDVVQDTFLRLHREFGKSSTTDAATNQNGHAPKPLSLQGRGQGEGQAQSQQQRFSSRSGSPSPSPGYPLGASPVEGEGVRKIENVQAWLYTVCRRRALDIVRKETRMKTLDENQTAVCELPESAPSQSLEQRETENSLLAALAGLPTNQQEVVRLKFQDGLSYRDIAEVTGLSQSNVGYLLHTAVKRLRTIMTADAENDANDTNDHLAPGSAGG